MDHAYPLKPWYVFWENTYDYELKACFNKECSGFLYVYEFKTVKCPKFQLDNLSYIEALAKKRKLV